MKKKNSIFVLLVTGLFVLGIPLFAQSPRPTGAIPTPEGLRRATQPAVMSRMNIVGEELPSRVNLAEGRIRAFDQGPIGSCGSVSVTMAKTLSRRIHERLPVSERNFHSPSFLFNQVNLGPMRGSYMRDNLNLARDTGVSTIITFPYTLDTALRPCANAFREARRYQLSEWRRIEQNCVDTFRMTLAQAIPIMIVHRTYHNMFSHRGGIYHPTGERTGSYHAVVVVGYCDTSRSFLAMNSWGESWNPEENGFFRFSYNTLRNGGWIRTAYVLIPALPNPAAPSFPANVEASRGSYSGRVALNWDSTGNSSLLHYEVFRLGPNGEYVSLGTTRETSFVDSNVRQGQRYFYLVRSHTQNLSSALSFPVEGWARDGLNAPPGIPSALTATVQEDNTVVLRWNRVETAERYVVYSWRGFDWFKVGETTGNFLVDTSPARDGSASVSYIVVAENRFGRSLPSNSASVVLVLRIDEDDDDDPYRGRRFDGNFYTFPIQRFRLAEQAFIENFQRNATQFRQRFGERQQQLIEGFFGGRR
ncbi:MAG: hypothetical protein FWB78_00385 [Treponema sp.]|nr:hypothetical protein [Treponema sp.]